jgi:hypothetical protein
MRTPLVTTVSILFSFDAFAWAVGVVPTLYYASAHKALPTVGGIRLIGGTFESLGIDAVIVAGDSFRLCQHVEGSRRVLAVELEKRWSGPWSDPNLASRDLLVWFCAATRPTARYRGAHTGDACLEGSGLYRRLQIDASAATNTTRQRRWNPSPPGCAMRRTLTA